MWFTFKSTLKVMGRNKQTNLIVVFTLFVAYLFFFIACSYVESGFSDLTSFRLKDEDTSLYYRGAVDFMTQEENKRISEEKFRDFFGQYDFIANTTVQEFGSYKNEITQSGITYYLIAENYTDFFQVNLVEGRYFTQEEMRIGKRVCIITEGLQEQAGLSVGDYQSINGIHLEIIGVRRDTANNGIVFIPSQTLGTVEDTGQYVQGYQVQIRLSDMSRSDEIGWQELGLKGEATSAKAYHHQVLQSFFQRGGAVFAISFFILAYALVNLMNILINKLDQQKKGFGIQVALGVSYQKIFMQFLFECLLLVLAAIAIVFLCEPLVKAFAYGIFNHYFGIFTLLTTIMVSLLSAFCISLLLFRGFRRMDIVKIVKEL